MSLKTKIVTGILICVFSSLSSLAYAVTTLPDPSSTFDGLPVAIQFDDFFSYSAKLLDLWGFAGYDVSTGTGLLDVLIYTGAVGQDNQDVGAGGAFDFEDPMNAPGGGTDNFSGWWGQDDQDNDGVSDAVNGPVLVDTLLSYMHATFGPDFNVPVFSFDMNEGGRNPDLNVVAEAYIWDPVNLVKVHSWAFDNTPQAGDGVFDPTSWVLSPGEINLIGASTTPYQVRNNIGSGKLDFLLYAPTMDLNLYTGSGYYFVGDFRLKDIHAGPEELYLTGAFSPFIIPEPASIVLLGSGIMGLAGARLRRKKNHL